ncbi:MAG: signal peptide peptidase SppA [Pseudomonadota bacterium]
MKRQFRQHKPLFSNRLPKAVTKPKMKWRILPILWLAMKRAATALGFLVLLNIFIGLILLPAFLPQKASAPTLPDEMVLFLSFEDGLNEVPPPADFSDPFAPVAPTVSEIVEALDMAREDNRVKGLIARMYDGSFSLTHVTEVRTALKRFRESGKFAHIYSSSYGEGGGGLGRYYLASAFDEIWMQPLGIVSITGVGAEIPFFRDALDKVGVTPQFYKRKDYKTAYESITDSSISPENKETLQRIVRDIRNEILTRIPEDRGMSAIEFERLVNKGLFTAPEAAAAKLITHADYGDVLLDNVAEAVTGERDADALELINLNGYYSTKKNKKMAALSMNTKPKVALVYAVGAVMPTSDGGGLGSGIAAADEIAPALHDASKDESVEAIILRIDSPGGSPSASESILRAVEKAQERGKPVIVSMGATAASGGYWIGAYADKIYALPNTLTGSIGVVGGKFAMQDLFAKIGVNWEEITWGRNAGMWSLNSTLDASEAERVNNMLDHVYDSFVARVAKGRKMDLADVDKIAGGRVWSGRRAVEVGLVDELGGLEDAIDYAAVLAGEESRADINLVQYPKPKTPLERVLKLLGAQVNMGRGVALQQQLLERAAPVLEFMNVIEKPHHYTTYEPLKIR